jgi:predicted CXXCH cytochrome family protein
MWLAAALLGLLVLVAGRGGAVAAITVVYPAAKSLVTRSDYLILKMNNPEISGVKVTINGVDSETMIIGTPEYRRSFRDFLILQANWDQGKNSIRVEGFNGAKSVETTGAEIYYQGRSDAAPPPAEFKTVPLHVPEKERLCSPCHNMNPTTAQSDDSLGKGNPCYVCHNRMLSVPFVHGPAGTFSCTFCHDGKDSPRYAVTRRESQLCGECHAEQVAGFKKRKFQHGPVEAGLCEICHDPHGSANPSQLRMPINALCLSCHENVGKTNHVLHTTESKGHPLSGVPDPSRPGSGRMLSCTSCHNPHAADVRYYFPNNIETSMDICTLCHNK